MDFQIVIEKYKQHKISISEASKLANLSLWEFMDELKKRSISIETDEANSEESLKEFK